MGQPEEKKKKSGWLWIMIVFVAIIVGAIWWYNSSGRATESLPTDEIANGEYQAVFLDSGQVYFGKLKEGKEFYALTDVFYLQTGASGLDQTSSLSLIKLGSEAHGPEDKMEINKEHILFVEDMKSDSKVVKAILDYKSKKTH